MIKTKNIKEIFNKYDLSTEEINFLVESNAIEREYSSEALEDAIEAWNYAKQNIHNINQTVILEIHRLLMQKLNPEIAGKFREEPVYICSAAGYKPVLDHKLITREICKWLKLDKSYKTKSVDDIKKLHVKFENIHPFVDGNGRTGRILMNMQMLANNHPILVIHTGAQQYSYYRWFQDEND